MTIETYLARRAQREEQAPQFRDLCVTCLQPPFGCYCGEIKKFDPKMKFVILTHPIEVKRRIATGRMSHLMLENSHLIAGEDYSQNKAVNRILALEDHVPVILYPGRNSTCLTDLTVNERSELLPTSHLDSKNLTIFVIDGTWATARKTMRKSQNLTSLPRICFRPSAPSRFRVRKQPAPGCYSTIEAIHEVIELIGASQGFDLKSRKHDALLDVFDSMVEKQLRFLDTIRSVGDRYRRRQTVSAG